jgi:hypothetical protein
MFDGLYNQVQASVLLKDLSDFNIECVSRTDQQIHIVVVKKLQSRSNSMSSVHMCRWHQLGNDLPAVNAELQNVVLKK